MDHDELHKDRRRVISRRRAARILNGSLPVESRTNEERVRHEKQVKAIKDLTSKPGKIQAVEGMAATGWISHSKICQQVWRKIGKPPVGMALSAQAAKALQDGGDIKSEILALRLLQQRLVVRDGRYWIRRSKIDCLRRQFHDKWSRD